MHPISIGAEPQGWQGCKEVIDYYSRGDSAPFMTVQMEIRYDTRIFAEIFKIGMNAPPYVVGRGSFGYYFDEKTGWGAYANETPLPFLVNGIVLGTDRWLDAQCRAAERNPGFVPRSPPSQIMP